MESGGSTGWDSADLVQLLNTDHCVACRRTSVKGEGGDIPASWVAGVRGLWDLDPEPGSLRNKGCWKLHRLRRRWRERLRAERSEFNLGI